MFRSFHGSFESNFRGEFLFVPVLVFLILLVAGSSSLEAAGITTEIGCQTQILYDLQYGSTREGGVACPQLGPCDNPVLRDANIPDSTDPIKIIRTFVHLLRNDDGSNPVGNEQSVHDAMANLNAQYLPWRIQFVYDWDYINSTQFRVLDANWEFNAMKTQYAIKPDSQCNIFVATVNVGGSSYSYGTFPWDPAAVTATGGIVMTQGHWPPYDDQVIGHEMGHNLGLWHTHHGVDEVSQCGECYEEAGGSNGDYYGDLCSETDPTPTNFGCGPPGGTDPCSGLSWGPTDFHNIMGYSSCQTEFEPQQAGRIHCWSDDVLSGWQSNVQIQADTTFGPYPLEVNFFGATSKTVISWHWDFGDGGTDNIQAPTHLYNQAGVFDVACDIVASDGDYGTLKNSYIWIHADTVIGDNVLGTPGQTARVDVYARNYLPLEALTIPFKWDGPLNLDFDSASTTGLRTEYMPTNQLVNQASTKATYFLSSGGMSPLPADTGAVVSLYFTIPSGVTIGSNDIVIESYGTRFLEFSTMRGAYEPASVAGKIALCTPGDVDGNGSSPNVADLTYLVDYLFNGGWPPINPGNADCDGSGNINVTDITYLVDYLFNGGPPPICG